MKEEAMTCKNETFLDDSGGIKYFLTVVTHRLLKCLIC